MSYLFPLKKFILEEKTTLFHVKGISEEISIKLRQNPEFTYAKYGEDEELMQAFLMPHDPCQNKCTTFLDAHDIDIRSYLPISLPDSLINRYKIPSDILYQTYHLLSYVELADNVCDEKLWSQKEIYLFLNDFDIHKCEKQCTFLLNSSLEGQVTDTQDSVIVK